MRMNELLNSNEENTKLKQQNEELQRELFDAKMAEENIMKMITKTKLNLENEKAMRMTAQSDLNSLKTKNTMLCKQFCDLKSQQEHLEVEILETKRKFEEENAELRNLRALDKSQRVVDSKTICKLQIANCKLMDQQVKDNKKLELEKIERKTIEIENIKYQKAIQQFDGINQQINMITNPLLRPELPRTFSITNFKCEYEEKG